MPPPNCAAEHDVTTTFVRARSPWFRIAPPDTVAAWLSSRASCTVSWPKFSIPPYMP
jgi:hypothetical protein